MKTDAAKKLSNAMELFRTGQLPESLRLFIDLLKVPELKSQALAGIGLIKFQQEDFANAEKAFTQSLEIAPSADAEYGLGVLAQHNHLKGKARRHFARALEIDPTHVGSRNRIAAIDNAQTNKSSESSEKIHAPERKPTVRGNPESGGPTSAAPREAKPERDPLGDQSDAAFYRILADDAANPNSTNASLSRECLSFIDSIRMEKRPARKAYPLTTGLAFASVPCLALAIILFVNQPSTPGFKADKQLLLAASVILAVVALISVTAYVAARRTFYVFYGGWLTVRAGIVATEDRPYELTHLINAVITRGPIDLLTGFGSLHLNFDKQGRVRLFGLASGSELSRLRDTLLNGARALRSHPLLKGLIGT